MNLKSYVSFLILGILIYSCSSSDHDILQETNKKLQNMKTVQYQTTYKNYNPIDGGLGMHDSASVNFDFNSKDSVTGAKYLIVFNSGEFGFNGYTAFSTFKERKLLRYVDVKSYADLPVFGFLTFSIQTLRNLLPQFLNDTSIYISRAKDTILQKTECYRFNVISQDKVFDVFKGKLVSKDYCSHCNTRNYALLIDKENYLPKQFISYTEKKVPNWIISYDDFKYSIAKSDLLFNYKNRYLDYEKYTEEEFLSVNKNMNIRKYNSHIGTKTIDWKLPSMSGDSVCLSKIKSKLVLLDFWFPYCGGCIKIIPDINKLQKDFKNKGLSVYGIEFTKSDNYGLKDYIEKFKIEYPTLYCGKKVASDYGISGGSSIFLINKTGKIVYASLGFNKGEIIKVINENL